MQRHLRKEGEHKEEGQETFGTGDTVGCGIEWRSQGNCVVFWTRNGVRLSMYNTSLVLSSGMKG
jgi:hypothetical protein